MDTHILKDMIALIRTEQERRSSLLNAEDPDYAYDHWIFWDEPFINELCLMFLVTLRHQVEREFVGLAARAVDGGCEISYTQYKEKINQLRKLNKQQLHDEIEKRLNLKSCRKYDFMEALRLLTNSYKHDLPQKLHRNLLKKLQLESEGNYAPLPESDSLRKGLANFIGIGDEAGYCDIAEQFVDIASDFMVEVKSLTKLSKVERKAVSINPKDFAQ
jgi:hypothetical protein